MSRQLLEAGSMPVLYRREEIRLAIQRLDSLRAGSRVEDCVLFYYGVPTVGKSTLLREIKREAEKDSIATALVDFDRETTDDERQIDHERYDDEAGQVRLAQQLMHDLIRTSQYVTSETFVSDVSPDEAAQHLLDFARDRFGTRHPFVLFFDTVEDADPATFRWLQEKILVPLIDSELSDGERPRVLVVMAGRTQPNLTIKELIFPIERRLRPHHLQPFSPQQTMEQLAVMRADLPGVDIYEFTGGLPGLNDRAARWVVKEESEAGLARYLVDDIFKRLARKQKEPPKKLSDTREVILAVAPLRQFDADLLQKIIEGDDLFGGKYAGIGFRGISQLLRDLQQTRLVEPHPDGYGYVVVGRLRFALDKYWRQDEPKKHFHVHQVAAEWFQAQVGQKDFPAIADRIYHLGGMWRDVNEHPYLTDNLHGELRLPLQQTELLKLLAQELETTLGRIHSTYDNNPFRALKQVEKIKNVLSQEEFKILLASNVVSSLTEQCERFKEELETSTR